MAQDRIGEVMEAATSEFTVQRYRLYSFARECDAADIQEFSSSHEHLQTLLDASSNGVTDLVIAAFLRQVSAAHPDAREYLLGAGKALAIALRGQLPRLRRILTSVG